MKSDYRKLLIDSDVAPFVLKGLRSASIKEPSVATMINGNAVGRFQGLEVYEKVASQADFPQTVADLVSNSYFRLTYQKPNGTSATFGTSIIGACSFRTADNILHLIPTVTTADVYLGDPHRLRVSLSGIYGDFASLSSVRTYTTEAMINCTQMIIEVRFVALKEIKLHRALLGTDVFRIFSISSMYLNPNCYDGSLIRYSNHPKIRSLKLQTVKKRGCYLFSHPHAISEIELIKEFGSTEALNTPGSPDSPSLSARILDASIPTSELGIQAYLAESIDQNDDSLSIWLEWSACPAVIPKGEEVWAKIEFSATPPSMH